MTATISDDRPAMRLIMAIAPNETITSVFPENMTDEALADAFVTPSRCASSSTIARFEQAAK